MEIAVADMADQVAVRRRGVEIGAGLEQAVGQPRDRHADVGDHRPRAGPQRARRIEGIVPRLPERRPVFGQGRPLRHRAAEAADEVLELRGLTGDARRASRGTRRTGSAVRDARSSHRRFSAAIIGASRNSIRAAPRPSWMAAITACTAPSMVSNGQTSGHHRFRQRIEPHRQFGDHAQRAFRADHQRGQVVAGRALRRASGRCAPRARRP